ncbi:tetratricopeptide repeat protein [Arsenicibacter rosenii]|uniref:Tetratricopeptide repeat protein n=1 Tax=Arsenicibacter rosenii TaxID=1750698 RepID=A0A1S2VFN4_9BACT|nr:tetratricopeptide repeat protein [Arsenicibacter rosenii]OIN57522.1 hypothetical protein BLX24_18705 [Arsenicibacter rosenii]
MKQAFYLCLLMLCASANSVFAQEARSVNQAIHFIKLANTLRAVRKSDESISLLKRALPAVASKNPYWEAVTNEMLGLCYNETEDYAAAIRHLELARAQFAKLKYVASAWGVNEVLRDISGKNMYAGIQIGASDVKLAIFKTQYESDFYEKDIRSVINVPDLDLTANANAGLQKGQIALQTCLDSIRQYKIPNERVFIVFSSEVTGSKKLSQEAKKRLYEQLAAVLPEGSQLQIDSTLTPAREAELFTIGAIPRKVWPTTSALNIGANSVTIGYFDKAVSPSSTPFHYNTAPVGVNTLVSQVDARATTHPEAFGREVQQVVNSLNESALVPVLPGLAQRRTVGVGGAIVAALVAYLYPEKAFTTAVPVSMADVTTFKNLALTQYESLIQPGLAGIEDYATRDKASQDIRLMQNRLTRKQLIAGATLLEATFRACNKTGNKRFVFIRDADIGWVTGKFLETINFEYESTIAKGSLYTR